MFPFILIKLPKLENCYIYKNPKLCHKNTFGCIILISINSQNEDEDGNLEQVRPARSGHFLRTLRSNNPFTDSDDYAGFFDEDEEAGNSGEIDALLKRGKVTTHFLRLVNSFDVHWWGERGNPIYKGEFIIIPYAANL